MLILDSLPERQEATRLPRDTDAGRAIFKSWFYHNNTGTGTHTILEPSLAYWHWEFTCPSEGQRSPRHTWTCRQHFREPAPPTSSSPILLRHQPITQKASLALQWDHSHLRRQSLAQRGQRSAQPTRQHRLPHHSRKGTAAHTRRH